MILDMRSPDFEIVDEHYRKQLSHQKGLAKKNMPKKTKLTDLNIIASRPAADLNYANLLYSEAMRSAFDRINPVDLAKMPEDEFLLFSEKYKKSIQRIVRLTLEAQIELK